MFTKNCIKMCEKAEEIQKLWKPKQFDCYYSKDIKNVFILAESSLINIIEKFIERYIWLPTQEQLMNMIYEIIGLGETHLYAAIQDILEFLGEEYNNNGIPDEYFITAKEKLLAFIYKQKYNKIWDGENWIKEAK